MEEILAYDMPFYFETKGEDMKEPQEDFLAPTQPETNKVRESLSLPSLRKAANPYRLPIPLKCRPKKADNDKKPLKIKDDGSVMVNIFIWGKEIVRAILDLKASINIISYCIYQKLGLGKLKSTPMTLQLADGSINV